MDNYFSLPESDYYNLGISVGPDDCIYILSSKQVGTIPWTTDPIVRDNTRAVYQGCVRKFSRSGELLKEWQTGNYESGYSLQPGCMAIGSDGRVYVGEHNRAKREKRMGEAKVTVFDSDGILLDQWGERGKEAHQFRSPTAISIGSDDSVLLADSFYSRVHRFTSSGAFISCSEVPSSSVSTRPLVIAVAVAMDNSYYAAVSDQICKFAPDGNFAFSWGGRGIGPGEFSGIRGIALDQDDKLYVFDRHQWDRTHPWVDSRIQVFGSNGGYLGAVRPTALIPNTAGSWGSIVEITLDREGGLYTLNRIEGTRYVVLGPVREIPLTTEEVGSFGFKPLDVVRNTLYQGFEDKVVLNVIYIGSSGESSSRLIEVHHIGPYYFHGYCRLRNDFRTFVIARVRNAQPVDELFGPRSDCQPPDWVDSAVPITWDDVQG